MVIKVCVLNVHSWHDAEGRLRLDDTIALLKGFACDLVLLNEVPDDTSLGRVAHELCMDHAYGPAQWAGNAILSRSTLREARNVPLPAVDAETRAVLMARATFGPLQLTVACTHLDHASERARLSQLAALRTAVADEESMIGGDFNALRLTDYPAVRLQAVREHRAENRVEPPRGEVVARLDQWGFIDAARWADAAGDYRASLGRPISPSLRSTCWAGTRVDYLWLSGAWAQRVSRVQAQVIVTDVSDHRPLLVTLET